MTSKNNNPKSRDNELVVQELKGELLVYDLNINQGFCLNATSAAIWNLCNGNNSVSDIAEQLSRKLKQPVTDELVYLALDQFKTENLLSDNERVEIKFGNLSRREVVRKIGLASVIALPVIASLVAPTAAMAQSGVADVCAADTDPASTDCTNCPDGTPCSSGNGACSSGTCVIF